MPEETTNHRIDKPEEGSAPWTSAYYELADVVEVTAEVRAPESSLNDYEPHNDSIFRATDTGAIYRGNGTNWIKTDLEVADARIEDANLGSGTVDHTPSASNDIANKAYVDEQAGGGDGGTMSEHGNEYHSPDFASEGMVNNLTASDVNALPDTGGTVTGRTIVSSSTYRNHLRLRRSGVGTWDITPTTRNGDSLAFLDDETGAEAYLSSDEHIEFGSGDRTVMTGSGGRMDVQDSFPTGAEPGDICIRTDEDLAYYYDGSTWNPFSDGSDGGGGGDPVEPDYYVDDYERDSLGSAYTNIDSYITSSAAFNGNRGLRIPPSERDGGTPGTRSTSGLDYYPAADGGPSDNGAFQFAVRNESMNGSLHIFRIHFAWGGDEFYTFQFDDNGNDFRLRENYTDMGGMHANNVVGWDDGAWYVVRVHEWRSDGTFDVGLYDDDPDDGGAEIWRGQGTDSRSNNPTSGGIGFWSNDVTAFSIDDFKLLE